MRAVGRAVLLTLWFAGAAGLLWVAVRDLDPARLFRTLGHVTLWPLGLALVVDLACLLSKAGKWKVLLSPVGRPGLLRLLCAFYAAGATALAAPFRLDEVVRAFVASRLTGLSSPVVWGSMALERVLDFSALLLVMLVLALRVPMPPWFTSVSSLMATIALLLTLGVLALHLLAPRLTTSGPLVRLAGSLVRGGSALRRPRLLAGGFALLAAEWLLNVLLTVLVIHACGVSLPLSAALLISVLSITAFALPFVPAGMGAFEVAMRLTLPELYGVSAEDAVTVALVHHALLLTPMVLLGTAVLLVLGIRIGDARRWRRGGNPAESAGS